MNRRELLGLSGFSLLSSVGDKLDVEKFSEQKSLYIYSNIESLLKTYPLESIKEIICNNIKLTTGFNFDPNLISKNKLDAFSYSIEFPICNIKICDNIIKIMEDCKKFILYRKFHNIRINNFNIDFFIEENLPFQFGIYGWIYLSTY